MDDELYVIGEVARRTGLPVRTIRFYADEGIVPPAAHSRAGYRLFDLDALNRLDLVRTLRDLGLPLATIRGVLEQEATLSEVAAAHADAIDVQLHALRLRRAVLRAVAKHDSTPQEVTLMHRLAQTSEAERQRLITDFVDATFGGLAANDEFVAFLRSMVPELPDDPEPAQVRAWVELAELVQDPDFRASMRRMAQHQADERAAGDPGGLHHELTERVRGQVTEAITAGIDPRSPRAALILDGIVARYTETFATHDTPEYRRRLLHRVEVANDPRAERYLHLLSTVNGWPVPTTLAPVFDWFITALKEHPLPSAQHTAPMDR